MSPVENHLEAVRVGEGCAIGIGCRFRCREMRDQAIKIKLAGADQIRDRVDIATRPFGGDADTGFAHKGGRECKAQRLFVKTGECHFAAFAKPADQ